MIDAFARCDCAAKGTIRCDICERNNYPEQPGEYLCETIVKDGANLYDVKQLKFDGIRWLDTDDEVVAWRKIKE